MIEETNGKAMTRSVTNIVPVPHEAFEMSCCSKLSKICTSRPRLQSHSIENTKQRVASVHGIGVGMSETWLWYG